MRYFALVVGIMLFAGLVAVFMTAAADLGTTWGSRDADAYSSLAVDYEVYVEEPSTNQNSTTRSVWDKLKAGEFGEGLSAGTVAIDSGIEGVKLLGNTGKTAGKVIDKVENDSEGLIHPIIPTIIKGALSVALVLMVLYMFMRFKAEV